ncbi:hypothetical protein C8R44DRAFT_189565 [Mycena epipterygia]|nr:hypothetical protein C8R44DRAFT_189565 [Mycena epipterygia]
MEFDTKLPASEPERVQDLWFEDGNLVIQAENHQFRVYRGILAARSSVFQDMLAFPQPPDSELIEGCPLVRLYDAATEVTVFLKAIFDSDLSFFMPFPSPTDLDIIVSCLRLSHKYGVDYLRRRALIHLSSGHHTSLSESDSVEYHHDPVPSRPASEVVSWPWPDDFTYNMCVIELAREVEALWVLPTAFYVLSTAYQKLGSIIFHGTVYHGIPTSLSLQDQQSFITGRDSQIGSTNADILRFLLDPPSSEIKGCKSPNECSAERLRAFASIRERVRAYPAIPLEMWKPTYWDKLGKVCPACLAVLKDTHRRARQAFWDKLPGMYGLPPWAELEKMKEAAIGNGSPRI